VARADLSVVVEIGAVIFATLLADNKISGVHVERFLFLGDRDQLDCGSSKVST
jgi:hypothetical protein